MTVYSAECMFCKWPLGQPMAWQALTVRQTAIQKLLHLIIIIFISINIINIIINIIIIISRLSSIDLKLRFIFKQEAALALYKDKLHLMTVIDQLAAHSKGG